eukprot:CAMPEP_0197542792 /NCGR_PEP_ID=MMETSP1318-20131121/67894_1 /TAXON_ID=552666 /ORGANISM="Partenskyella glossopodia, Strain RCC365" /LENGTH=405 /DNA_ID=CAMNT_0043102081 /DNA_START=1 /DNA_END=1218 /DNA_ORIENTATION=+
MAARYGIVPQSGPSATGIRMYNKSRVRAEQDRSLLPGPMDFEDIAKAFNDFSQALNMDQGYSPMTGDIVFHDLKEQEQKEAKLYRDLAFQEKVENRIFEHMRDGHNYTNCSCGREHKFIHGGHQIEKDESLADNLDNWKPFGGDDDDDDDDDDGDDAKQPKKLAYQNLPGVRETGKPEVKKLQNGSAAVFGRKMSIHKDAEKKLKGVEMIIQCRATNLLADAFPVNVSFIEERLHRYDLEDFQSHLLSCKIVFDMSLEDLIYERDDAQEDVELQHGGNTEEILRKRGQIRARRWWKVLRDVCGKDRVWKVVCQDPHLRKHAALAERALEIQFNKAKSLPAANVSRNIPPGIPPCDDLARHRHHLLSWAVSSNRTKYDLLNDARQDAQDNNDFDPRSPYGYPDSAD